MSYLNNLRLVTPAQEKSFENTTDITADKTQHLLEAARLTRTIKEAKLKLNELVRTHDLGSPKVVNFNIMNQS
jgi:hypothetical protein